MATIPPTNVPPPRPPPDIAAEEEMSLLKQMKPHVPGIVIFADHSRPLPWTVKYHSVVMFADVSGFTALCESYSTKGQSGVDSLTRTLNEYLSALVEIILASDGDILKFAGDAILVIWRVGRAEALSNEITKVVQCCLDIQHTCGHWNTDIGVKLTVKIGVSAGEMSVTFLGNQEYRHYVELGPAVTAVNVAENFCQSGMVVMSPDAASYCNAQSKFETELLEDQRHIRILSILPRRRSCSLPVFNSLPEGFTPEDRRLSALSDDIPIDSQGKIIPIPQRPVVPAITLKTPISDATPASKSRPTTPTKNDDSGATTAPAVPTIKVETDGGEGTSENTVAKPKTFKSLGKNKMKFGKLRKVVETVTEMRLDIALRLYILPPVLKKFDDNQPLEYLSEMRQVVIVFMNLVLDGNQETEHVLQKTFELVYFKSKSMHGSLNKVFLFDKGCTFLVIFGLPGYKHEDDCAHALICAGRMKGKLDKIDGVKRVSIGITTGTTFCGVVGHPKRHEYSVIGRKVNMAARLMMHYPDKITCDTDTFQKCRLPPAYFVVLITKRMKGLRNVGVIHEFTGISKDDKMVTKSITKSPFPMLGRTAEDFLFREHLKATMRNDKQRRHLIFSGPSGIGKTKLLDQLILVSNHKSLRVISCRVELEDSSYPYFVANHIMRALFSNGGYSHQIDREPYILDAVGEQDVKHLYLVNEVLGLTLENSAAVADTTINEKATRRRILYKIAKACVVGDTDTVIIIDDAHNIDIASWEVLCELMPIQDILIVLGLRPSIIDMPPCREAMLFIENPEVKLVDLGTLDLKYMAPLACQMMNVVSIPSDLDRLLRERIHGVPAWCKEILKDMLDKNQLLVVLDDGRPEFRQSSVAPKRDMVKPRASFDTINYQHASTMSSTALQITVTELPRETAETDADRELLSALGLVHDTNGPTYKDQWATTKQMSTGGALAMDKFLKVPVKATGPAVEPTLKLKTKELADRIAVFAKGINAKDIPVPMSMKELIIGRIDSMRASDQLMIKCAAVLGKKVRRDILEMLLPKAHRAKLVLTVRRLMESGIFQCGNTPPYKLVAKVSRDDGGQATKYRCYCHQDDVRSRAGDLEACFEPMFTNNLLQQTAYDVLMESQRTELHGKAAHYFELSADELRASVPYYVLCRPPGENLQEKITKLEFNAMFLPQKLRRRRRWKNKVSDEMYAKEATEARTKRGRRLAVSITEDEAVPMVHRILEEAKPIETLEYPIESLLPLYDNICHHWRWAGQPWNVLTTMAEAAVAALYVNRNSKALELILLVKETLDEFPVPSPEREIEYRAIKAKVNRLHAKVLFKSGDTAAAYDRLNYVADILGMERLDQQRRHSRLFATKIFAKFLWNWRINRRQPRTCTLLTMEQGYCLIDLYKMDREIGDSRSKFVHAIKHFNKVMGQRVHLHQVMEAYSAVIECCRERDWLDTAGRLEAELLTGCAARSDELSTEDRCLLAGIYAKRCIHFFLEGQNEQAYVAGKTAAEICMCVHDMETAKILAPYYFYLCLARGDYRESLDLLEQLKFSAQISDDVISRAMYYTLCVEIATAGGFPPDSVGTSMTVLTKCLQTCDASAGDFVPRFYAAMTTAVWCARKERWSQTQVWFDYWETYQTEDTSYFALVARAKKVECMLLSLSISEEIGNTRVAAELKKAIPKDLSFLQKAAKKIPTLSQRCLHLECYFKTLTSRKRAAKSVYNQALRSFKKHGNQFEKAWLHQNFEAWSERGRGRKKGLSKRGCDRNVNKNWQPQAEYHQIDWELIGTSKMNDMYVLPLPVIVK